MISKISFRFLKAITNYAHSILKNLQNNKFVYNNIFKKILHKILFI